MKEEFFRVVVKVTKLDSPTREQKLEGCPSLRLLVDISYQSDQSGFIAPSTSLPSGSGEVKLDPKATVDAIGPGFIMQI